MMYLRELNWFFCLVFIALFAQTTKSGVLSIAHRGNSMYAPENTLSAFLAAEGKADFVETDARVSKDGVLVIMHDASVNRTTDGAGNVSSLTLAQLRVFDAGSWFSPAFTGEHIPTLEEMVMNTLRFATPLIEHKAGSAAQYVAELRRLNAVTNVLVQSFDWNFLADVQSMEPSIRLCALGSGDLTTNSVNNIAAAGARTVAWEKSNVAAAQISLVHDHGMKLFVWTVDSPAEIQNFIDLGVDGIISNDPASVKGQQTVVTNGPTHFSDHLVAYWKFDDGLSNAFATVVADSHSTNNGTLTRNDGASHWMDGGQAKLSGSLNLQGASAFVSIPQTYGLDIHTNALTLSAWVWLPIKPSQLASSYGAIFDSKTDCYVLYLDKSNKELRFKVTDADGDAARPGIPETFLQTNQWIHVAATYSGSETPASGRAIIYLNGQSYDTHTGNDGSSPIGLTGNVKPGQMASFGREGPTGANYFAGGVDDVAIWSRALSAAEVADLFQAGQSGLSLGDFLSLPTPLIAITSVDPATSRDSIEIRFRNLGPWQTFKLARATVCGGPFQVVDGIAPIALGGSDYRFVYPLSGSSSGYFRIQGE